MRYCDLNNVAAGVQICGGNVQLTMYRHCSGDFSYGRIQWGYFGNETSHQPVVLPLESIINTSHTVHSWNSASINSFWRDYTRLDRTSAVSSCKNKRCNSYVRSLPLQLRGLDLVGGSIENRCRFSVCCKKQVILEKDFNLCLLRTSCFTFIIR